MLKYLLLTILIIEIIILINLHRKNNYEFYVNYDKFKKNCAIDDTCKLKDICVNKPHDNFYEQLEKKKV